MRTHTENLLKFVADVNEKASLNTNKENSLVSHITKVGSINFDSILYSSQNKKNNFFYWNIPANDFTIFCYGSIFSISENGAQRTENTENKISSLHKNFTNNWNDYNLSSIPLIVGGMKFSADDKNEIWHDFADSEWKIPQNVLLKNSSGSFLITNFFLSYSEEEILKSFRDGFELLNCSQTNGGHEVKFYKVAELSSEEEKNSWTEKVKSALDKISKNEIQKIVLSRKVQLKFETEPKLYKLLSDLSNDFPKCYIFAFKNNDSIFFGASPEKLAKISDGWIEADALAGSFPRGENEEDDKKLADELLNSKKNLAEQKAVVEFIEDSFKDFSDEIIYDKKPIIRKLSNIQHLWTPIKAKLNKDYTIFHLLKSIHPTPAICGAPWSVALSNIKQLENFERGLFAGITGWFNFENEGEFAVSIRSALLKGNDLYAFAGCGIVEGSDPEVEFEETELKLKPILSLFENEKTYQP